MFRKFIDLLLRRRHYWRSVSFDEIAELYTSRLITVFASNIISLFAAVYLYKLGYSLQFIALFYGVFFALRVPFAYLSAKYVSYAGPRHGILVASLLRIPSLAAFAMVPLTQGESAFWALVAFGLFQNISLSVYNIAYTASFSRVKSIERAGREIGTMQTIERAARVVSPIVGGVLASVWSPEATIILAAVLFLASSLPLFSSVEPSTVRNRLRISGFPWRLSLPSIVAQSAVGVDFMVGSMVWTLFMTVFIFAGLGDTIYAALGGLASLGVLVAMVAAWVFGQLVDRKKGHILLTVGIIINSVTHLFRPFVSSLPGVAAVGIASETSISAYTLPFTRVVFDVADSSGFRVTYLMFIEISLAIGGALTCFLLYFALGAMGVKNAMTALFVFAAIYELIMLVCRRAAK